jgi:gliding motility-associated-like protein
VEIIIYTTTMKTIGKIGFMIIVMLFTSGITAFGQGEGQPGRTCDSAGNFCADQTQYTFNAGVNSGSFGSDVTCLGSTPNPAWYAMQVGESGRINIHMYTTPQEDIDFACWGPFNTKPEGCGVLTTDCPTCNNHGPSSGVNPSNLGGYPVGNIVDCSYAPDDEEYVHIPNAVSGQWYLLLVTNFSNQPAQIHIGNDPSSTGTSNCAILSTPITDTVCLGETAVFKVDRPIPGARYTWECNTVWPPYSFTTYDTLISIPTSPNIGGYDYSQDPPAPIYFGDGNWQFTLTISVSENQPPSDPRPFTFIVNSKPTITLNTDSICMGESATLTASGGSSFVWNTNENAPSITVSPAVTTQYSVIGTSTWGCKDTAQTQVVVFNNPNITMTPAAVCSGELATAIAPNALNFVWSDGTNITDTIRPIVTTQQVYTVTVTMDGGCSGTATLTANPNPIIEATATEICQGESSIVSVIDLSGNTSSTYTWSNGSNGATISVSPFNNMDLSVVATTQYGCMGYDTTTVIVHPKPTSGFLPSSDMVTIDEGDVVFNDMSTNATTWNYNFGEFHNPSNTSMEQNPTHTYISAGYFKVWQVVTSEFGCADSSYKRIQVEAPYFFYVPSAFTPDNDGKNEEFCPKGKGIDSRNYTMEIYDRWGTLIFKTNTPLACWDGKYNGEKASMGSYIYKINLKDMESKYHEYMGTFVILK